MPSGARILHVAQSNEPTTSDLCIWALVDPEAPTAARTICIYGTGHPCGEEAHIGTVEIGPFVWHVFDAGEER
jgi:hypothetical protein